MKVIFLNQAKQWGGGEHWTVVTARGLAGRGHDVTVIGLKETPLVRRSEEVGLDTRTVPGAVDYSPVAIARLAKILREKRTDVLITHHNRDVRTGGVAARILRIAVVHRNGFPILANRTRDRLCMYFVDRILTNSRRILDRYQTYGWVDTGRIDVVPNGIRSPEERSEKQTIWRPWGLLPTDLIAAFAGRVTAGKGVAHLLEVWANLDQESRWRLVVIGTGPEEDRLHDRATRSDLAGRVTFTGFREDAHRLIAAAHLVLLPSAEEGMPNCLLEAMSCGVPVVATPVGDVPYLLDDGNAGWLLPLGETSPWLRLLGWLESNPHELSAMGRAGAERVKLKFTLDSMLDGVETCLSRALVLS